MKKRSYFASEWHDRWLDPQELERYFLAPPGEQWFGGPGKTDTGGFRAEGVDGTEHLAEDAGRVYLDLNMWGSPDLGVLLYYWKRSIAGAEAYTSVGDLRRLDEKTRGLHGDILPVGLFIPFEQAWIGVKEFLATDGGLPKSIEWIANKDLPSDTFPEPTYANVKRYGLV